MTLSPQRLLLHLFLAPQPRTKNQEHLPLFLLSCSSKPSPSLISIRLLTTHGSRLRPGDKRWKKLERSIAEFELVQPIIWNRRTGHIVGGHQRCEILKHQGRTEVECVVVDLPLSREKALNVALNNSEVGGDWEATKLMALIQDLAEAPDVDPTLTGFDEHQLQGLRFEPAAIDDEDEPQPASDKVIATWRSPTPAGLR